MNINTEVVQLVVHDIPSHTNVHVSTGTVHAGQYQQGAIRSFHTPIHLDLVNNFRYVRVPLT
jgi:hypothetical protein